MSTSAIPVHVGLVDNTGQIHPNELASCAAALNEQIQADFGPVWHVRATVGVYGKGALPPMTWKVEIDTQLDQPGALGYHSDTNRQPWAKVELTSDWTVTVSHELLEMLADPYGSRPHTGAPPEGVDPAQFGIGLHERVSYLLEVCDPCEATSYLIGGEKVSDFLLPGWYRTTPAKHPAYSHAGGCARPREVADGGYVSFANVSGEWWQVFNEGGAYQVSDLGHFDAENFASLREWADCKAREFRA